MFIVVVYGLFAVFFIRNTYSNENIFIQEEASMAFKQLLECPLNKSKSPPTVGIAIKDHPYVINMSSVHELEQNYNDWKPGLILPDDDVRIILYNGTKYIILGANITRSKVASVKGYAFCPPESDPFCHNGNITVQVIVTGD
jgi:hypothetical protein